MASCMEIQMDEVRKSLALRTGDSKGDVLVRAMECKQHLERAYGSVYGGLSQVLEYLKRSPDDTEMKEKEIRDLMRKTVLVFKAGIRMQETTANEIVPGSFPPPQDEPTTSFDFDCETATGLAVAICAVATGGTIAFPPLAAAAAEACIASIVAAAIACA